MDYSKIIVTDHLLKDRADRIKEIQNGKGFGTPYIMLDSREDEWITHIMTDTDVIFVIDKVTMTCLTLYIASPKQKRVFVKYGTKIEKGE